MSLALCDLKWVGDSRDTRGHKLQSDFRSKSRNGKSSSFSRGNLWQKALGTTFERRPYARSCAKGVMEKDQLPSSLMDRFLLRITEWIEEFLMKGLWSI
uniref:Uncharacterized protein n=1 Tax=Manihot esculenta TaxID=3983 RepID=A0A2C9WI31_MANES